MVGVGGPHGGVGGARRRPGVDGLLVGGEVVGRVRVGVRRQNVPVAVVCEIILESKKKFFISVHLHQRPLLGLNVPSK